jgi:hypothetical protein
MTNLCPQSKLYLIFSIIMFLTMVFQNSGNVDIYCLGKLNCDAPNLYMIYMIKILYTVFWTVILQMLCTANQPIIAWALLFYPILLYLIMTLDLFIT